MTKSLNALEQQKLQYRHDQRNHFDILSLRKTDRLKHYGLHFAKYVGRFVRSGDSEDEVARTLVDALLVSLSCANTLHVNLAGSQNESRDNRTFFDQFADHAGRLADACEKVDHLEPFEDIARDASLSIFLLLISEFEHRGLDAAELLKERRKALALRQFYIE